MPVWSVCWLSTTTRQSRVAQTKKRVGGLGQSGLMFCFLIKTCIFVLLGFTSLPADYQQQVLSVHVYLSWILINAFIVAFVLSDFVLNMRVFDLLQMMVMRKKVMTSWSIRVRIRLAEKIPLCFDWPIRSRNYRTAWSVWRMRFVVGECCL